MIRSLDPVVRVLIVFEIPGVKLLAPSVASLLGSPIDDGASVSDAIL